MRIVMILLFFISACAASRPEALPAAHEAARVIPVCVVNDANAPVPTGIVSEALKALSESYRVEVGIALDPHDAVTAPFKPSGWPMDIAFALAKVCPDEDELRFVFSDRFVSPSESSMTALGEGGQMAGDSHPYYGFVVVYSAQERWKARNLGGERALIGTLKHELGHVFGLEDSQDKTSFMYFSSNASLGRWTDEARRTIRADKWRRWWPKG